MNINPESCDFVLPVLNLGSAAAFPFPFSRSGLPTGVFPRLLQLFGQTCFKLLQSTLISDLSTRVPFSSSIYAPLPRYYPLDCPVRRLFEPIRPLPPHFPPLGASDLRFTADPPLEAEAPFPGRTVLLECPSLRVGT